MICDVSLRRSRLLNLASASGSRSGSGGDVNAFSENLNEKDFCDEKMVYIRGCVCLSWKPFGLESTSWTSRRHRPRTGNTCLWGRSLYPSHCLPSQAPLPFVSRVSPPSASQAGTHEAHCLSSQNTHRHCWGSRQSSGTCLCAVQTPFRANMRAKQQRRNVRGNILKHER